MNKILNKVFNSTVKVLDEQNMIIDHCISDEAPDRVGDVVYQDGIDTKDYMNNPVVLDSHNYDKPSVGKCLRLYRQGNQTRAQTQFAPTDEGKKYYALYKDGFMKAFSIGFIPIEYSPNKSGGYDMSKSSLLEYSVVSVPCNPRALKSLINKEFKEDVSNMKKKELETLIKKSVDAQVKELNETHKSEIEVKDEEIKTLKQEIKDLKDPEIKSGAKHSKTTVDVVTKVCEGMENNVKALKKLISTEPESDDGNKDEEKDYSDEEIQKMIEKSVLETIEKYQDNEEE